MSCTCAWLQSGKRKGGSKEQAEATADLPQEPLHRTDFKECFYMGGMELRAMGSLRCQWMEKHCGGGAISWLNPCG